MNLSGKAIKYYMKPEGIEKDNILVITDDLNLEFGTLRMKAKGTDGGHNGLKDTQLNTPNYPRLRFGNIGRISVVAGQIASWRVEQR
jgi:PTH1 family peptidyl-tRNA hydrolase